MQSFEPEERERLIALVVACRRRLVSLLMEQSFFGIPVDDRWLTASRDAGSESGAVAGSEVLELTRELWLSIDANAIANWGVLDAAGDGDDWKVDGTRLLLGTFFRLVVDLLLELSSLVTILAAAPSSSRGGLLRVDDERSSDETEVVIGSLYRAVADLDSTVIALFGSVSDRRNQTNLVVSDTLYSDDVGEIGLRVWDCYSSIDCVLRSIEDLAEVLPSNTDTRVNLGVSRSRTSRIGVENELTIVRIYNVVRNLLGVTDDLVSIIPHSSQSSRYGGGISRNRVVPTQSPGQGGSALEIFLAWWKQWSLTSLAQRVFSKIAVNKWWLTNCGCTWSRVLFTVPACFETGSR
jgi:hypothetical protein